MDDSQEQAHADRGRFCTTCGARLQSFDRFCPECGTDVQAAANTQVSEELGPYIPVPGAPATSTTRSNRKRRRRRPWFRRPLIIVPLLLLLLLCGTASAMFYRTWSAFDDVKSQSTPPPEISGDALGGDDTLVIDTGPAQEAVAARERERSGTQSPSTVVPPTAETDPATTGPGSPTEPAVADEPQASADAPETPPAGTVAASEPGATQPAAPSVPAELNTDDGINILLMGVDARPGEAIDVGVRPDSLAVLNLDEATGSCRVLAIPRDSRVEMPGYGNTKINHALAVGGIPFEQLVVEDYLGITIDHYALIDFTGVVQVVDAVGGVTVDNPEAFTIGDTQFAQGRIELDGEGALLYSRYRGGSDGDFGRVSKQQQVLRALLDESASLDLVRMIPSTFSLLSDHFRSDLGPTSLLDIANSYRDSCTSATIETHTIPGQVGNMRDDMMQMELSFVVSKPEDVRKEVDWLTGQGE